MVKAKRALRTREFAVVCHCMSNWIVELLPTLEAHLLHVLDDVVVLLDHVMSRSHLRRKLLVALEARVAILQSFSHSATKRHMSLECFAANEDCHFAFWAFILRSGVAFSGFARIPVVVRVFVPLYVSSQESDRREFLTADRAVGGKGMKRRSNTEDFEKSFHGTNQE
jgi:hypothetical protein